MKVCHLTSVHPPYDTRILLRECTALKQAGHDVSLVVPTDQDSVHNGIRILAVPKRKGRLQRMLFTTYDVLRRGLDENADAYHFHDPELMPAGWWLMRKNKKVIYDVHENVPRQILQKNWLVFPTAVASIYRWVESLLLPGMNIVTAAASNLAPYRSRFPHCVEIENFPDTTALSKFVVMDRSLNIPSAIYIGSVTFDRGIDTMLNALGIIIKTVSEFQLHIVGPCESATRDAIAALPCYENVKSNVAFHGALPQDRAYDIARKTRVGWCVLQPTPNYLQTYSTKIFEYMAVALPVVASDFDINKAVVEAHECGLCVPPLGHQSLAAATLRLIQNSSEATRMGFNGMTAVENHYNWKVESQKLVRFYEELI